MMDVCTTVLAFITVGVSCLAIHLYVPVPSAASEPIRLRIVLAVWRLFMDWVKFRKWQGKGHEMKIIQQIEKNGPTSTVDPNDTVQSMDTKFDDVPVRIYRPKDLEKHQLLPGIMFFHGGGWCFESFEMYHKILMKLARKKRMIIIFVRYRLAPDFPFPAPLDDCTTVARYICDNSKILGIDRDRLGVMGDSAGGNLAAALMIKKIQDSDGILSQIKLLVLIYPALQAVDFLTPSYSKYRGPSTPTILSAELMAKFWVAYGLGTETVNINELLNNAHWNENIQKSEVLKNMNYDTLPENLKSAGLNPNKFCKNATLANKVVPTFLNPLFSPLLVSDDILRQFPSTFILSAEFDPLRDDSFFLKDRMMKLSVNVKHRHWPGMDHTFFGIELYKNSEVALLEVVQYLNENL